ncbi:hypothetical protein HPB47_019730 [Ixodes persulcatus]|uniref:Uncharacterized protein n=1 Tax=Ixodes persulcatus TaxID=34615 RepID=A0AC60QHB3_IXOPE|nr:hypothetical protein HPB47_019730 [Ixodes persulcatus]
MASEIYLSAALCRHDLPKGCTLQVPRKSAHQFGSSGARERKQTHLVATRRIVRVSKRRPLTTARPPTDVSGVGEEDREAPRRRPSTPASSSLTPSPQLRKSDADQSVGDWAALAVAKQDAEVERL